MLKACRDCEEEKPFSEFYKTKKGTHGLNAYCKVCYKKRYHNREAARLRTAKYRETNHERWKAMHRVHQFNRKSTIKAVDDGTVTDAFVKEVYSRMICYWCGLFVDEEDRTLEHVVELIDGGAHSASNIEMACLSCNSARLGRKE